MKIEESIMKVLAYFDMFNYPVTQEELKLFCNQPTTVDEINTAIDSLPSQNLVYRLDGFISLQNNLSLAERRKKGNQRAEILFIKAQKIAALLYHFPYVRAVGVSGSVSKNFADDEADIDYFIITKANRLWIARTFLHLYKKLPFVKGRKHLYCMNYFVDEAELVIEEKNIYTATELITLMPMNGDGCMNDFFKANAWAFSFFPNFFPADLGKSKRGTSNWIKKTIEFFLNSKPGNWLDNYFLKLTAKRWQLKEKQGKLNTKGETMGLKTSKHCSKPNPVFFHDTFIKNYEKKLSELRASWDL